MDLARQPNGRKSTDSRFLKKILTDTEIDQTGCSADPEAVLWSFWAAKEAVYKVLLKKNGHTAFIPNRWSVRYRDFQDLCEGDFALRSGCREGEVGIPGSGNVYIRLFTYPSYVHCIASDKSESLNRIVARVDRLPRQENSLRTDPSLFVRSKLLRCLARHFHLAARDMNIVREPQKDGLGPPLLYIAGVRSAIDLSISHDGCYVAYAYLDRSCRIFHKAMLDRAVAQIPFSLT
ncbi:MAG TPA: 4'-phosphopantetheinyl transferase superfamily protein [Smithellaceae bacterium]|nr:4'-phosphopantetheinyl transferase superfamily protein [Smithellaceae bacterium]HRY35388.1 4'-phosphopantetheinyl transferase superfamily protein [Smithellaceae bacterium]